MRTEENAQIDRKNLFEQNAKQSEIIAQNAVELKELIDSRLKDASIGNVGVVKHKDIMLRASSVRVFVNIETGEILDSKNDDAEEVNLIVAFDENKGGYFAITDVKGENLRDEAEKIVLKSAKLWEAQKQSEWRQQQFETKYGTSEALQNVINIPTIQNARSFDELALAIYQKRAIAGSKKVYLPEQIIARIKEIRTEFLKNNFDEPDLSALTDGRSQDGSSLGIRDVVRNLLKIEKKKKRILEKSESRTSQESEPDSYEKLISEITEIAESQNGVIAGSQKVYKIDELIEKINAVRHGEADIKTLPKNHGIRERALKLIENN